MNLHFKCFMPPAKDMGENNMFAGMWISHILLMAYMVKWLELSIFA
jgi:hypothetical protein